MITLEKFSEEQCLLRALLSPFTGIVWTELLDFVGKLLVQYPVSAQGLLVAGALGDSSAQLHVYVATFRAGDRSMACFVPSSATPGKLSFDVLGELALRNFVVDAAHGDWKAVQKDSHALFSRLATLTGKFSSWFPNSKEVDLVRVMQAVGLFGAINATTGKFELQPSAPLTRPSSAGKPSSRRPSVSVPRPPSSSGRSTQPAVALEKAEGEPLPESLLLAAGISKEAP
eukprot:TRINITY_DN25170_c0_g1_i1.p1 TRINITY_DN25170_c0_g1~~TRINITY_DN25170_c0_g1_i1.p1  ORF type:complete len:229 (+),score=31.15 TRINITY_DN25170_c0_g1_i1:622-1308(+)